jgi:hypothetical protein
MRTISIIACALAVASCGRSDDATRTTTGSATAAEAATPVPAATPTRFPQPSATMDGLRNGWASPDVAAHAARQERCLHWRAQRDATPGATTANGGYERDCRGIDAELLELRRLHASDGRTMALLRRYEMTETGA